MKTFRHILLLILLEFIFSEAFSQVIEFGGFIDSYHAVRLQDPYDFMSSRSRLRTEVRGIKGNSAFMLQSMPITTICFLTEPLLN